MRPIRCALVCLALASAVSTAVAAQTSNTSSAQNQAPATAQQPRDIDDVNLEDLLNITVSIAAGRVQLAEEAPGIVSVVTDEEIRRMGARTLADVLQTVPGFEVLTDNLGRSHIAVRGVVTQTPTSGASVVTQASSENLLVLFNGHRLNEHFTGGATVVNLEIPLYNIKQVEIIRGPGSALFGANAFLAVINLVSYTAKNLEGVEVSATAGSFGTQQYSVVAAHTTGDLGVSASFQFSDTTGPKLLVPADAQTLLDQQLRARLGFPPLSLAPRTTSGDRRGVDFSLNTSYKGLVMNARVRDERGGGFIGFLDSFGGGKDALDSQQILADVSHTFTLAARTSLSAKFSFTQSEVRNFLSSGPPSQRFPQGVLLDFSSNSRRHAGEIVLDRQISATNQLTLGAGYEAESTYDPRNAANFDINAVPLSAIRPLPYPVIPVTSRKIASAFAQDTWNPIPGVGITAGVRYDHYNDFGHTVNPRAGLVWRLPKRLYVKTLYGRAFRAPTFTELFVAFPGVGAVTSQGALLAIGNPNLKPSTINTVELAVGYRARNTRMSATYFTNVIRDFIAGPVILTGLPGVFINTPGLHVQGVELDVKRTFGFDHAVFANYTYQQPKDRPADVRLARDLTRAGLGAGVGLPSHLATLGFTAGLGQHVSLTPTLLVRGERPRSEQRMFNTTAGVFVTDSRGPVAAYAVVNLNVRAKELFDRLEIAGTIGNLFDRRYVDPSFSLGVPGDYPKPGRNGLVKVTYKF